MPKKIEHEEYDSRQVYSSARPAGYDEEDVFGNEEAHDIRYKTLSWPMVAVLMIAEIVSVALSGIDTNALVRHAVAPVFSRSGVCAALLKWSFSASQ
jgi:hypothetical protein